MVLFRTTPVSLYQGSLKWIKSDSSQLIFGANTSELTTWLKPLNREEILTGKTIFEATEKAVMKNIRVRYDIKGFKRKDIWDYPLNALREAILNAICHRDYTVNSDIMIKIFDDHIYFWNPGELLGNLTVKELLKNKHKSERRNILIAQYFYDIGEIEQYGSGIQRMMDACEKAGLPLPEIEESQGGFAVTFKKGETKGEEYFSAENVQSEELNERQQILIEHLKQNKKITLSEYRKLMPQVSEKTLYRDLQDLVAQKIVREKGEKRWRQYFLSKKK